MKCNFFFIFASSTTLIISFLFLSSCTVINEEDIIDSLLPNLWLFLTNFFAGLVIFLLIFFFAWKPTQRYLKKRRDFINDEIVLANKIKIDAFKEFNKAEKIRVRAFLDAKNIISNATNDATLLKNEMHKSAKNEVDKMIADAKYEIEKINNQNTSKINETIVNVATTISKAFLKENNNSNNKNWYLKKLEETLKNKDKQQI